MSTRLKSPSKLKPKKASKRIQSKNLVPYSKILGSADPSYKRMFEPVLTVSAKK